MNTIFCVNKDKPTEIQRMVPTSSDEFQCSRNEYEPIPGSMVARINIDQHLSQTEAEKVATLMAAAPELYRALNILHDLFDFSSVDPLERMKELTDQEISHAFAIGKDALHKANNPTI